jgi:hypothetical protein
MEVTNAVKARNHNFEKKVVMTFIDVRVKAHYEGALWALLGRVCNVYFYKTHCI